MTTDKQQSSARLGFIGMDAMGSRMAGRLLAAGYDLTVYNLYNREWGHTSMLEQRGAKVAATPRELASRADIILSSVADDAAVENVMTGSDGALTAARPSTTFIEMSTISSTTSRRLYEVALGKGVAVLDSPVSGSTPQAEQGQLVIFVGGEKTVYDRCQPILGVLARETFYMGPSGSGVTMKLCVNTLLGLGMQALAEAITLGLKAGLQRERLLEVLGGTVVLSPSQQSKLENVLKGAYPPTFPLRLMFKDFGLILDTAMHLAAAQQVCAAEFARQSAAGRDQDFSSVVRTMEQMAGV
jgi:3-hydroxyisobutyrate dehydrogenase